MPGAVATAVGCGGADAVVHATLRGFHSAMTWGREERGDFSECHEPL